MILVVTDTGPLHSLVLIGQADVLPALFDVVIVRQAVADELQHPHTPASVRQWIAFLRARSGHRLLSWERRAPARLRKPRWSVALPGKTPENWQ